jgi:high-affinity nickel permease
MVDLQIHFSWETYWIGYVITLGLVTWKIILDEASLETLSRDVKRFLGLSVIMLFYPIFAFAFVIYHLGKLDKYFGKKPTNND